MRTIIGVLDQVGNGIGIRGGERGERREESKRLLLLVVVVVYKTYACTGIVQETKANEER
jgi:hypothetical protein